MSDRDHDRASQLFLRACELPTDQRTAFLDDACAGDDALRDEVVSLLKHDATVPQILEPGALPVEVSPAVEPMPERIGRFHIIAKIGEGGMGVVFRAEQREPIRRRAAVKLIRTGLSGTEALTRFATEQRAMALMTGNQNRLDGGSQTLRYDESLAAEQQSARKVLFYQARIEPHRQLGLSALEGASSEHGRAELFQARGNDRGNTQRGRYQKARDRPIRRWWGQRCQQSCASSTAHRDAGWV